MSETLKVRQSDSSKSLETKKILIAYKSPLYEELMKEISLKYGDSGLKSLIKYAESLGMDAISSRRATNEELMVFIAQRLGKI